MQSREVIEEYYAGAKVFAGTLFNDRNCRETMGGNLMYWLAEINRYEIILEIPEEERMKVIIK